MNGTVVSFDAHRGLGEVMGDDGMRYPFHCVEIRDGSRRIEVGRPVTFEVVVRLGQVEAAQIEPL